MTKALGLAVVTCAAGAIMVVTASNAYAYECEVLSVGTTDISPPGIPGYLYPDGECVITPPDEAFLRLLTEGKFCGGGIQRADKLCNRLRNGEVACVVGMPTAN